MVLICISWFLNLLSYLFTCLLINHLYIFCGAMSIQILCPFWNWIVFLLNYGFFIHSRIQVPHEIYELLLFSLTFWGLSFHLVNSVLWSIKRSWFRQSSIYLFCFVAYVFVSYLRIKCQMNFWGIHLCKTGLSGCLFVLFYQAILFYLIIFY